MNEFDDFYEASLKIIFMKYLYYHFWKSLKLKMKNSKLICKKLHQNQKIMYNNKC
jgi:hypothetical protein